MITASRKTEVANEVLFTRRPVGTKRKTRSERVGEEEREEEGENLGEGEMRLYLRRAPRPDQFFVLLAGKEVISQDIVLATGSVRGSLWSSSQSDGNGPSNQIISELQGTPVL